MKRKINTILLIDDDPDDNLYHQIIINKMNIVNHVEIAKNGIEGIAYLTNENQTPPDIIFLDLNMPKMNGWEFLEEYKKINLSENSNALIVILTTSENPDHLKKAQEMQDVDGYETKPLSKDILNQILEKHFSDNL